MISIIIPIYNAEQYLRQCLDSIISQDYDELELLLIDDGSVDGSLGICREFAAKDSRIIVVQKENTGVSDTRNAGLERATGDYVLFVDADDYLVPGALGKINTSLQENGFPDMLVWSFESFGERKMVNDIAFLRKHTQGFRTHQLLQHLISIKPDNRLIGFIWRCAFKRSLLNAHNIRFDRKLKMSEDYKFMLDTVFAAGPVSVLAEVLYRYRLSSTSATAKYKSNVHDDMAWVNQWMEDSICSRYPELRAGLECCRAETYIVAIQNLCNHDTQYSLLGRIRKAWEIRAEFGYTSYIKTANKQWRTCSRKRSLVYLMLRLYMEPLYILLFSIKRGTLFERKRSKNL